MTDSNKAFIGIQAMRGGGGGEEGKESPRGGGEIFGF